MRKLTFILLTMLLCISSNTIAQKLKKHEVFNLKKLDAITKMSEDQKEKVQLLYNERTNAFKETNDWYERRDINALVYKKILNVLSKKQRQKVFSQFLSYRTTEKHYHNIIKTFPESYKVQLFAKVGKLEDSIRFLNSRYIFDAYYLNKETQEINERIYTLLKEEQLPLKKAMTLVKKRSRCAKISDEELELIKAYEFFTYLNIKEKISSISSEEVFQKLQEKLAFCNMQTSLPYLKNYYEGRDSISQKLVRDTLQASYLLGIKELVKNEKSLDVKDYGFNIFDVAKNTLEIHKEERKEQAKKEKKTLFLKKAKEAGIDKTKAQKVFKLIAQRDKDIQDYHKAKNKNKEFGLSVSDPENEKTPWNIKRAFAKDLTRILTIKEYGKLLSNDFVPQAKKKAKLDLKDLLKANKQLSEETKKEAYQLMYSYYVNRAIATSYYHYDKTLQKQRQGMLTYRFEKEYKELIARYKLQKVKNKRIHNNTFQWN